MIAEQGEAEVTCEFCRSRYQFNREELELLLKEIEAPAANDKR
jgi:hypothetical protein